MSADKKLRRWLKAGLLDEATVQRIRDFERTETSPVLQRAVVWLGSLTIGIGLVSVVAANWSEISDYAKLSLDGLLVLSIACAVFVTAARKRSTTGNEDSLLGEGLIVIYYALTLCSLALLGQIYQTGTPPWVALLLWSSSTLPLMLLARSGLTGWLWFFGLSTSTMTAVFSLVEHSQSEADLAVTLIYLWWLVLLGASSSAWFRAERARVARALRSGALGSILVAGVVFPFAFYLDIRGDEQLSWSIAPTGLFTLALGLAFRWILPQTNIGARRGLFAAIVVAWVSMSAGLGVAHDEMRLIGLLVQLVYLCVLAWTSLQCGRLRWFNVLTGLIAVRILAAYFEVFGSMLSTGLGMVVGGALTLLMAWLWRSKSGQLAVRLASTTGGNGAVS